MAGRVHNALSGVEFRKALIHDIEVALEGDTRFEGHLTFPVIEWEFELKIEAYPVSEANMRVKVSGQVQNPELIEAIKKAEPPTVVVLKGGRKVGPEGQAPDEVRAQTGQPVTVPMKGPDDITFEQMEQPAKR